MDKHLPRFLEWCLVLMGMVLYALAFDLFLIGNDIAAGGLSGVAVVLRRYLPLSIGTMTLIMNIPVLLAAGFVIGWKYSIGSVLGAVLFSFTVDIFAITPTLTHDPLVAAIFGGAINGLGMAMITFGGGSVGGTDLLCRVLVKLFPSMSMGKMSAVIDGGVVVLAMVSFGNVEVGLYAIITIFTCSFICDRVILGFRRGSLCMIVTSLEPHIVATPLMHAFNRGITKLSAKGMFTDSDRNVLLLAVHPQEVPKVKSLLSKLDEDAFVLLLNTSEMIGGSFRSEHFGVRRL